ncbi:hypothetical protein R1sor_010092 [Riccia sorocarpa]|uniref:Uncharacterized protein n=1 Tax=Riccia sorocarpa TaxID=122646 RepID=A0ABD3HYG6_9MARC
MESNVKVEHAPGKATTEVANSSGRVGEVGCVTGTEDTLKSKKIDVLNGELDTAWAEEDFILSEDYFAKECRLPNDEFMPNVITKALVSDEEVERCFGPRSGTKGRNGPKLNNCVGLPQSEVLHLFQVIDGHEKPVNNTLGATFPRALYAERFLKKRINWAQYGHERHRNQLRSSKARKESKPVGPHIVRPLRVYKPSADLILEPLDSEDASASPKREVRSPKHKPNLKTEAAETSMLAKEEPGASIIMGGSLGEAPESSLVIHERQSLLLHSLESEEEELNLKHSGVLYALEEYTVRLKQSQTELKLSRDLVEESKVQVENGEREIETAERAIAREQSKLEAQIHELNCLRPFAESPLAALSPRYIPTATEVTKTIFRLSSCPTGAERTWRVSAATTKVRSASPCSTVVSTREEERENDVSLVGTNHVPRTRSRAGKRVGSKGEIVRKDHLEYFRIDISALPRCGQLQMADSSGQVQLFHFFIETAEPRHLLEVWDRPSQDLFQMTGQEFFEKYGHDVLSLRKFVSSYLASTAWAITVIGTPSADSYLRVLSFSRAGIRSSNIASKVGSASAHVGVVVVPTAPDQAFLAMEITPSYGRSSLEALLRVQTRVDNLSREIAEAIAAIKLEQEEEFADSASEWA